MVRNIYSLFTTLLFLGLLSFNVNAGGKNIIELSNISLQGLKTIAVEAIIPTGGDYGVLIALGVTTTLQAPDLARRRCTWTGIFSAALTTDQKFPAHHRL